LLLIETLGKNPGIPVVVNKIGRPLVSLIMNDYYSEF